MTNGRGKHRGIERPGLAAPGGAPSREGEPLGPDTLPRYPWEEKIRLQPPGEPDIPKWQRAIFERRAREFEAKPRQAGSRRRAGLDRFTRKCARGARLRGGFRAALKSEKYRKSRQRKAFCGKTHVNVCSPELTLVPVPNKVWIGMVSLTDGRVAVSPAACHERDHAGCRPSDVAESIRNLSPWSLLTLTFQHWGGPLRQAWAWTAVWELWRNFLWKMRYSQWKFTEHRIEERRTLIGIWNGRELRKEDRRDENSPMSKPEKGWFERPRYVAVLEPHKDGWPHLHVVMNTVPPEVRLERRLRKGKMTETLVAGRHYIQEMKRVWMSLGGGHQVRWELLKENGLYIQKYVGKYSQLPEEVLALLIDAGVRLYNRSPGLKPPKNNRWAGVRGSYEKALEFVESVVADQLIEGAGLDPRDAIEPTSGAWSRDIIRAVNALARTGTLGDDDDDQGREEGD